MPTKSPSPRSKTRSRTPPDLSSSPSDAASLCSRDEEASRPTDPDPDPDPIPNGQASEILKRRRHYQEFRQIYSNRLTEAAKRESSSTASKWSESSSRPSTASAKIEKLLMSEFQKTGRRSSRESVRLTYTALTSAAESRPRARRSAEERAKRAEERWDYFEREKRKSKSEKLKVRAKPKQDSLMTYEHERNKRRRSEKDTDRREYDDDREMSLKQYYQKYYERRAREEESNEDLRGERKRYRDDKYEKKQRSYESYEKYRFGNVENKERASKSDRHVKYEDMRYKRQAIDEKYYQNDDKYDKYKYNKRERKRGHKLDDDYESGSEADLEGSNQQLVTTYSKTRIPIKCKDDEPIKLPPDQSRSYIEEDASKKDQKQSHTVDDSQPTSNIGPPYREYLDERNDFETIPVDYQSFQTLKKDQDSHCTPLRCRSFKCQAFDSVQMDCHEVECQLPENQNAECQEPEYEKQTQQKNCQCDDNYRSIEEEIQCVEVQKRSQAIDTKMRMLSGIRTAMMRTERIPVVTYETTRCYKSVSKTPMRYKLPTRSKSPVKTKAPERPEPLTVISKFNNIPRKSDKDAIVANVQTSDVWKPDKTVKNDANVRFKTEQTEVGSILAKSSSLLSTISKMEERATKTLESLKDAEKKLREERLGQTKNVGIEIDIQDLEKHLRVIEEASKRSTREKVKSRRISSSKNSRSKILNNSKETSQETDNIEYTQPAFKLQPDVEDKDVPNNKREELIFEEIPSKEHNDKEIHCDSCHTDSPFGIPIISLLNKIIPPLSESSNTLAIDEDFIQPILMSFVATPEPEILQKPTIESVMDIEFNLNPLRKAARATVTEIQDEIIADVHLKDDIRKHVDDVIEKIEMKKECKSDVIIGSNFEMKENYRKERNSFNYTSSSVAKQFDDDKEKNLKNETSTPQTVSKTSLSINKKTPIGSSKSLKLKKKSSRSKIPVRIDSKKITSASRNSSKPKVSLNPDAREYAETLLNVYRVGSYDNEELIEKLKKVINLQKSNADSPRTVSVATSTNYSSFRKSNDRSGAFQKVRNFLSPERKKEATSAKKAPKPQKPKSATESRGTTYPDSEVTPEERALLEAIDLFNIHRSTLSMVHSEMNNLEMKIHWLLEKRCETAVGDKRLQIAKAVGQIN